MSKRTKRTNAKDPPWPHRLAKKKPAHGDRWRRAGAGGLGMAKKEEAQERQERFSSRLRGTQSTLDKPPSNGGAGFLAEGTSLRLTCHIYVSSGPLVLSASPSPRTCC